MLIFLFLVFTAPLSRSQVQEKSNPILVGSAQSIHSKPISEKELLPPGGEVKIFNPKKRSSNRVVPGKGYPKGFDAAWQKQMGKIPSKAPITTFDAANSGSTPTDPTGAVGPNHYVNAWNSAFAIYDKEGNILSPPAALETIGGTFVGEDTGDPIVFYDGFADRFVITQFSDSPYSLLVAVSQGPDPVNDGWYTYRFETETLPDYPKFFVWGDGYYVTTNKDPMEPPDNEVVYVLERDKMLNGLEARHIGFPLPGIVNNGFYSPAGFHAVGKNPPPRGDAPILYFQDDAWMGVSQDHLKIWLLNVNWDNPENSSIAESQTLGPSEGVSPFHSTFDGGSFLNLSQPEDAPDVDALQGAVMYPTSYRRFSTHNSVVFNFVVDVDATPGEHAGIRWYELRQDSAGGPWRVYQEGTYAPDDSHRWCGSIGIDAEGNIGLGFTILDDNPEDPIFPSLRYTGRYAGDPLGEMTLEEEVVAESTMPDPSSRYGDYSHLSIDPVDEQTFWFIGEYFANGSRMNKVGVFRIAPQFDRDVGIVEIVRPRSESLDNQEEVTVVIRNFGREAQSNFDLWYSIDNGPLQRETFTGTIPPTAQVEFTFSTRADLSQRGKTYTVSAKTELEGDEDFSNDWLKKTVTNLPPKDVGVTVIHAPATGENLGMEEVVVTVENFGGEPQSNFPIGYSVNGGAMVSETFPGTLEVGSEVSFTFSQPVDMSSPESFQIFAATFLPGDVNEENNGVDKTVANLNCIPVGSDCSFGDGIYSFYLEEIRNENIYCTNGYYDFIGLSTPLDRSKGQFEVGVSTHYASGTNQRFSLWIDFNDNAVFEDQERLITSAVIPSADMVHSYSFELPEQAPLGEHIMRVRAGDISFGGDLNDPCDVMNYGNTQDYTVEIVSSIEESVLEGAELLVSSPREDYFDINLRTGYQHPIWITVYDLLGQKLVENRVNKGFQGYRYELDMSYAAPGVYLVRVGTRDEGKVKRIMVH